MDKNKLDKLITALVLQILGLFLVDYMHYHDFAVEVILSILNILIIGFHLHGK